LSIRDNSIDLAKGLGMFLVIWGHNLLPGDYTGILIYSFHMPLFFMLSGVFYKQDIDFMKLIKTKAKRLLIPFLFFSIFHYVFYLIWTLLFNGIDTFDFYSILKIVPFKDAISIPLWFFISLFEIIIIYYLLSKYIKNSWLKMFVVFVLSISSYLFDQLNLPFFYNYFHLFSTLSMLLFYALGSEIFNKYKQHMIFKNLVFNVMFLFMLLIVFIWSNTYFKGIDINGNIYNTTYFIYIIASISGIYLIWVLSNIINKLNFSAHFWSYVGKNSLGIFAIHMAMFEFSRPLVKMLLTKDHFLFSFMCSLLTLFIAIGANEILKKIFPFVYGLKIKSGNKTILR
jgi:fucose 4-O-acetylase-like acetyltransferase